MLRLFTVVAHQTLQHHYVPQVSKLAKIFDEPPVKQAFDLEDFIELSYLSVRRRFMPCPVAQCFFDETSRLTPLPSSPLAVVRGPREEEDQVADCPGLPATGDPLLGL
jgi:hypothetical protein